MEFKISKEEAIKELGILLDQYDWFYDIRPEPNAITVYVTKMTRDVMQTIPELIYNHHIKVGFAGYLTCGEKYGANVSNNHRPSSFEDYE